MSIEDVDYLKLNSIRQSYTFLVDSKNRDRNVYPEPNNYSLSFTSPFKNVIGIEVVDVSIPKTMYNIDYTNNTLYFCIGKTEIPIMIDDKGNETYDESIFTKIEIEGGDYTTQTFLTTLKNIFFEMKINLDIFSVSNPPELTNLIYFASSEPFIFDMKRSTISEVIGFDLYANEKNNNTKYSFKDYNKKIGLEKIYHSFLDTETNRNIIRSPGMIYLLNNKYIILRCHEIEEHLYRSLSYTKYNLGLGKLRINSYGYNDEKTSFMKVPLRIFHPIGKLSRITLRFETAEGELYDFKGINHNIVFAIYYYEPVNNKSMTKYILNPEYKINFIDYLRKQEEQEGDSDDNEDLSRDDINIYMKNELLYNKEGLENNNKKLLSKKIKQHKESNNEYKNEIIRNEIIANRKIIENINKETSSENTETSSENTETSSESEQSYI